MHHLCNKSNPHTDLTISFKITLIFYEKPVHKRPVLNLQMTNSMLDFPRPKKPLNQNIQET